MGDASALVGGFHGGLVAHSEGSADGGPGVAGFTRLADEFGASGGHGAHPLLERSQGFEDVIGHNQTVTGVAVRGQVCNHSYMLTDQQFEAVTFSQVREGDLIRFVRVDRSFAHAGYPETRTITERVVRVTENTIQTESGKRLTRARWVDAEPRRLRGGIVVAAAHTGGER